MSSIEGKEQDIRLAWLDVFFPSLVLERGKEDIWVLKLGPK